MWVGVVAAAAMAVGACGTWATARYSEIGGTPDASFRAIDSRYATEFAIGGWEVADGWLVIASALVGVAGLWGWSRGGRRGWLLAAAVGGLGGLAVALHDLRRTSNLNASPGSHPHVDTGWGLWLTLLASAALIIATVMIARSAGPPGGWLTARRVGASLTLLTAVVWALAIERGPGEVGPTSATLAPFIWTSWAINAICSIWITVAVHRRSGSAQRRLRTTAAGVILAALSLFGCFLFTPFAIAIALLTLWRRPRNE